MSKIFLQILFIKLCLTSINTSTDRQQKIDKLDLQIKVLNEKIQQDIKQKNGYKVQDKIKIIIRFDFQFKFLDRSILSNLNDLDMFLLDQQISNVHVTIPTETEYCAIDFSPNELTHYSQGLKNDYRLQDLTNSVDFKIMIANLIKDFQKRTQCFHPEQELVVMINSQKDEYNSENRQLIICDAVQSFEQYDAMLNIKQILCDDADITDENRRISFYDYEHIDQENLVDDYIQRNKVQQVNTIDTKLLTYQQDQSINAEQTLQTLENNQIKKISTNEQTPLPLQELIMKGNNIQMVVKKQNPNDFKDSMMIRIKHKNIQDTIRHKRLRRK